MLQTEDSSLYPSVRRILLWAATKAALTLAAAAQGGLLLQQQEQQEGQQQQELQQQSFDPIEQRKAAAAATKSLEIKLQQATRTAISSTDAEVSSLQGQQDLSLPSWRHSRLSSLFQ